MLKDQNPLKEVEFPLRTVWSHSNVCLQRPGHFDRVPTVSKLQLSFLLPKKWINVSGCTTSKKREEYIDIVSDEFLDERNGCSTQIKSIDIK